MVDILNVSSYIILFGFLAFYFTFITTCIILAVFGVTFGVRTTYIKILRKVFEVCRSITRNKSKQHLEHSNSDEEISSESESLQKDRAGLVIARETKVLPDGRLCIADEPIDKMCLNDANKVLELPLLFTKNIIEAIVDDPITKRFSAYDLPAWNLLTRTNRRYQYISNRVTCVWLFGCFLRYVILFPFRFSLFLTAMVFGAVCACLTVLLPQRFRPPLYKRVTKAVFRILMRAFSAIITYHQNENRPCSPSLCVANHTSYLDVIVLGSDNVYAMVGQKQGGFFGLCEKLLSLGDKHIWFERTSAEDRSHVVKLMQEHLRDARNLPIVIFPEGTCINNTSVMQFKKGAFELENATVYPVAIRYDPTFADAFWNSSVAGMLSHMIGLMTSWAVVVDVYYLPPLVRQPGESGLQFANRVRLEIVRAGSFADVDWDGQLKREKPKSALKTRQQAEVSQQILRTPSIAKISNSVNSTPSRSATPHPALHSEPNAEYLPESNDLRKRVLSSPPVDGIPDLNGNLLANHSK